MLDPVKFECGVEVFDRENKDSSQWGRCGLLCNQASQHKIPIISKGITTRIRDRV